MDWFRAHFFSHGQEFRKKHLENHTDQIIFAALDMSETRMESRQYLRHAIIMGVLFFILGCAGTVMVLMIQGYRSVRSSLDLMKAEVERSRRLAAVGKLAAGVAHEIRNPLSSIKGFATWFRERYSNRDEDREVADVMIQEVERLNRAVTQLLELSKPLSVTKTMLNVEEIFAHSIKLIAQELDEKGIAVDLQVDRSLKQKEIMSDPDRLNQILLNLYLNAIQAMEDEGGTLGILATETGSGAGRALLLEVSDTGRGIDAADLEHIFDPYFTNRPGGTGLGLAMVHRAIEALGAEIRVESEKGEGTRFFIKLPMGRKVGK
jgi:two-component system sensor histidine kinase HydH